MRILVATDHYPPYIGGAQIQTQVLARGLAERGHEVVVATVWQNDMPPVQHEDGIPVYGFRQLRTLPRVARKRRQHHQPPFPDPVTALGLRRLVKRFKPDVVHSYGWISYSMAAALIGTDVPLVVTARDYAYSCANRTLMRDGELCSGPALLKCTACAGRHYGRPKGWIAALGVLGSRPLLRSKTSAIHSISTYVQSIIRRDFLDDRSWSSDLSKYVIHDVIGNAPQPDADDDPHARALDRLPDGPFILFVGALRVVKGIETLGAAYQRLTDPPPLVLIGTVEPDTPAAFPEGVIVVTDVPHNAVMVAWDRCLFGVLPSVWAEPFGTVVCEAMSRGKPVIGTAPGGHTDMIVHGESGFLIAPGDVDALADAMQSLISDDELRERMGRSARARADLFRPEVSLPKIEHLYEEATALRALLRSSSSS